MKRQLLNSIALAICVCSSVLFACQAPVFRYALERWIPGTWKIIVLSDGPLSPEQTDSLLKLQHSVMPNIARNSPLIGLQHIDLVSAAPADRRRWESFRNAIGSDGTPVVAALYPQPSTVDQPVASLRKLSATTSEQIFTSPVRSELASRLSAGHSAVWLFLESGNTQADQDAIERLSSQLKKDEQRLRLPTATDLQITPEQLRQLRIPLKLQFSVISLRRDDPREQFLVDSLLSSEADLGELAEPMAFPVFGRGRVLYALVGSGIDAKTISDASDFLAGPCSCQVKEQNPGFDLLLVHDWSKSIGDTLVSSPAPEERRSPSLIQIPPGRGSTPKPKN